MGFTSTNNYHAGYADELADFEFSLRGGCLMGNMIASKAISLGASMSAANLQRASGRIAEGESKVQAKQIQLAAKAREADRKERLAEAMASQNASAGARGIAAFEGSPLTILQADIEREERATERDIFASELEALAVRSRGKVARKMAKAQAHLTFAQGVSDALGGMGGSKPSSNSGST
jgi:hypothetical protein